MRKSLRLRKLARIRCTATVRVAPGLMAGAVWEHGRLVLLLGPFALFLEITSKP